MPRLDKPRGHSMGDGDPPLRRYSQPSLRMPSGNGDHRHQGGDPSAHTSRRTAVCETARQDESKHSAGHGPTRLRTLQVGVLP
jgi:hypothetical protein